MRVLDSYKVLQVGVSADMNEISAAYKRLCRENHPDLNPGAESEERMKDINVAYSTLCDNLARRRKLREFTKSASSRPLTEEELAQEALRGYFSSLIALDHKKAYRLLSDFDKSRISPDAFSDWRDCVERLYGVLNFSIEKSSGGAVIKLQNGMQMRAKKFSVSVTERELLTGKVQTEQSIRMAVLDGGVWRVFLGYSDISKLTGSFREKLEESRKKQFEQQWQEHQDRHDPELGIYNVKGLTQAAARHVYEYTRGKRPFVLAAFSVRPAATLDKNARLDVLRLAAEAIGRSIRLTDELGFSDSGVFVVLFANMKKRFAQNVSRKVEKRITDHIAALSGVQTQVVSAFLPYDGGSVSSEIESLIKKVSV
ncbi:MAG: DnaJ domain-containing protein [Oscillospiraceae bacterium]|jgi:curved DNA-binding protein CbpA|nr:DnaJ domain-containing protein [Oscillospiraceae bacterium]